MFLTSDGLTFGPLVLDVADATASNFGLSVAFGLGDSFWGKANGQSLRHVGSDPNSGTAITLHNYDTDQFPGTIGPIGVDPDTDLQAGISLDIPHNVQMYTTADLDVPPVLVQQEWFVLDNLNSNGTGVARFWREPVVRALLEQWRAGVRSAIDTSAGTAHVE